MEVIITIAISLVGATAVGMLFEILVSIRRDRKQQKIIEEIEKKCHSNKPG
jgi:hypothetical protein